MGVATGCGLRRYIDFLILLIPTPLVSVLFCSSIPTFLFIFYYIYIYSRIFSLGANLRNNYFTTFKIIV